MTEFEQTDCKKQASDSCNKPLWLLYKMAIRCLKTLEQMQVREAGQ